MIRGEKLKIWVLIPESIENFLKDCGVTESQITFAEMPLKKNTEAITNLDRRDDCCTDAVLIHRCHLLRKSEE